VRIRTGINAPTNPSLYPSPGTDRPVQGDFDSENHGLERKTGQDKRILALRARLAELDGVILEALGETVRVDEELRHLLGCGKGGV
jgi:hypothetical protein